MECMMMSFDQGHKVCLVGSSRGMKDKETCLPGPVDSRYC